MVAGKLNNNTNKVTPTMLFMKICVKILKFFFDKQNNIQKTNIFDANFPILWQKISNYFLILCESILPRNHTNNTVEQNCVNKCEKTLEKIWKFVLLLKEKYYYLNKLWTLETIKEVFTRFLLFFIFKILFVISSYQRRRGSTSWIVVSNNNKNNDTVVFYYFREFFRRFSQKNFHKDYHFFHCKTTNDLYFFFFFFTLHENSNAPNIKYKSRSEILARLIKWRQKDLISIEGIYCNQSYEGIWRIFRQKMAIKSG